MAFFKSIFKKKDQKENIVPESNVDNNNAPNSGSENQSVCIDYDKRISVTESNIRREKLFGIFDELEAGKSKSVYKLRNLQMCMHIYCYGSSFKRYIAFNRNNAMPVLVEEIDKTYLGIQISYEQYIELLIALSDLQRLEKFKIRITLYHGYTMQKLMRINSANCREYVLPIKDDKPVVCMVNGTGLYDATLEELFSIKETWAVYQEKKYIVSGGVCDGVLSLLDENGNSFFVDVYEVSDIYEKEYYIESKNRLFRVELTGRDEVIIEYKPGEYYESYGFKHLDPRGMGPGWEVHKSLIDSVKYKRKSKREIILNKLMKWEDCGRSYRHYGDNELIGELFEKNRNLAEKWEDYLPKAKEKYKIPTKSKDGKDLFYSGFRCICFERGDDIYDMEYICIDLMSGTPYYSHEQDRGSYIDKKQDVISWNKFREYAICVSSDAHNHFKGIGNNSWKRYLDPGYVKFEIWGLD